MAGVPLLNHGHQPVFRVVRASWRDPLDSSHSQRAEADKRWNTPDFPALYCCCSKPVARAVTLDIFRAAGVELSDLQPGVRPQLIEIGFAARLVDLTSSIGITSAGFPAGYPDGVSKEQTRRAAVAWHHAGLAGVVGRSPSLHRLGFSNWRPPHQPWGELALFVGNSPPPRLLKRHRGLRWFRQASGP